MAAADLHSPKPARDAAGAKIGVGAMAIRKILIVDDSPTERHVLNDMLTKAGYEVVASDNGEDALIMTTGQLRDPGMRDRIALLRDAIDAAPAPVDPRTEPV